MILGVQFLFECTMGRRGMTKKGGINDNDNNDDVYDW